MTSQFSHSLEELRNQTPTIDLEKLEGVKKIIVHGGNCPDGVASAMILNAAYQGQVPIEFLTHNMKGFQELAPEPGLLFCDLCPPNDRAREFLDAGAIVLDHHKAARFAVQEFVDAGLGAFASEKEHPGISGAALAYAFVWARLRLDASPEETSLVQEFARRIGIRDTWQKKDADWRVSRRDSAAVGWYPQDKLLSAPVSKWVDFMDIGDILTAKTDHTCEKIATSGYRFVSKKGTKVLIFRGTRYSSDLAEHLELIHDPTDIVVGFDLNHFDGKHKVGFSNRSHTGYDVSELAKAYGGGGHTAAAGFGYEFDLTEPNPYKIFEALLNDFEGSPPGLLTRLFGWTPKVKPKSRKTA